ncbi:PQQ-dependent sugar dehydrogenase [Shewanella waksmanii]|uniref:PQQ-dependent sugar dehydrogenase n=1 Tax=Shewanella waksmanii TaxID=213783 RepID=UPI0004AF5FB7|nr:PQQ-dependent sugar dehydrogenase [Shewanella waksmanii]
MFRVLISAVTYLALSLPLHAANYELEPINEQITIPWGITQLPDNALLITDRQGALYHVDAKGKSTSVSGLPNIVVQRQGGLLDVVLHPQYAQNGWVYISYSAGTEDASNTAIMRAKLKQQGDALSLSQTQILYMADAYASGAVHYGSRIAFDKQGYLYFSIGDRGQRDVNPQDISRDSGKIYRLNDDGTVPADNPFVDTKGAKTAIYSYGHRNPQGMALNPHTQAIWAHEHGPKGGDELNIIKKGTNYGWPVISYGVNYSGTSFTDLTEKDGMAQPITYWVPSIAPSAMVFVTSERYPELANQLLIGSLKFAKLISVSLDGDNIASQQDLMQNLGRVRSLHQGQDGYLYIGIDGRGVFKIQPQAASAQ